MSRFNIHQDVVEEILGQEGIQGSQSTVVRYSVLDQGIDELFFVPISDLFVSKHLGSSNRLHFQGLSRVFFNIYYLCTSFAWNAH